MVSTMDEEKKRSTSDAISYCWSAIGCTVAINFRKGRLKGGLKFLWGAEKISGAASAPTFQRPCNRCCYCARDITEVYCFELSEHWFWKLLPVKQFLSYRTFFILRCFLKQCRLNKPSRQTGWSEIFISIDEGLSLQSFYFTKQTL